MASYNPIQVRKYLLSTTHDGLRSAKSYGVEKKYME